MRIIIVDDEPIMVDLMMMQTAEVLPEAELHGFTDAIQAAAFAQTSQIDIAFLDVDMPGMNGLDAAKHLQSLNPKVNIIFCTGYAQYMSDAWKLYSSGFLMKPVLTDDIEEAVKHLRYPIAEAPKVTFHCFGNFEAYYNGTPITFQHQRTKELLAYLVDRDGVDVTTKEIMSGAFEDSINRSYFFMLRKDLIQTFEGLGIADTLRVSRSYLAIVREKVDCDLFDFLDGRRTKRPTEYMSQYSFGEYRLADILRFTPPDL